MTSIVPFIFCELLIGWMRNRDTVSRHGPGVQAGFGTKSAFCRMDTGGSLPGGKADRTRIRPLISTLRIHGIVFKWLVIGTNLPSPYYL